MPTFKQKWGCWDEGLGVGKGLLSKDRYANIWVGVLVFFFWALWGVENGSKKKWCEFLIPPSVLGEH